MENMRAPISLYENCWCTGAPHKHSDGLIRTNTSDLPVSSVPSVNLYADCWCTGAPHKHSDGLIRK